MQKKIEALLEEKLGMVKQAKELQNKSNDQLKKITDFEKNQKKNQKAIDEQKEEIKKLTVQVKEANDGKVSVKKELDAKIKEQIKEITLLEKDRFELVKIKTQMNKQEQKVINKQNENTA